MRNGLRKFFVTSALAVSIATGSVLTSAQPASARIVNGGAALACRPGQVLAYPPAYAFGTNPWANLETRARVWRWQPAKRRWVQVYNTGWWAQGATNQNGALGWFGAPWYTKWVTMNWATALFKPVNVPLRGYYYTVTTDIYDAKDGRITTVQNRVNVSNPRSSIYCYVG
jgi:hypothetical protein